MGRKARIFARPNWKPRWCRQAKQEILRSPCLGQKGRRKHGCTLWCCHGKAWQQRYLPHQDPRGWKSPNLWLQASQSHSKGCCTGYGSCQGIDGQINIESRLKKFGMNQNAGVCEPACYFLFGPSVIIIMVVSNIITYFRVV